MAIRGIGGIFFKAHNPEVLAAWYEQHLGVHRDAEGYTVLGWREIDRPSEVGQTVWAPFPHDTEYFAPSEATWMVNYRVHDLDAELARLAAEGVLLVGSPQDFEYGRFAWGLDCEGNKFELWEPPVDAPFPVTVPQSLDHETSVWLCDPGKSIATDAEGMEPQIIVKRRRIPLPVAEVWRLWTTGDGLAEWLVGHSRIDLRLGGPYEFYFDPDEEPGSRGGEGNKILSFLPERMLSFTWNAPPELDYTRERHTHVVVEFAGVDADTLVTLSHLGFPSREQDAHAQWAETFAYFETAWESVFEALEAAATSRK